MAPVRPPAGVVEEHRVEHVARRRVQAEADVRQAEDDLDLGELGRDPLDPVEGLEAEAAVVLVAGADGEGQRVDQQIVAGQAVRLGERDQAARDLDLALGGLGHAGLVDGQRDHRGAELLGQRQARRRRLLAVLEVDRVDHRLAAVQLERRLEHAELGRIEHERAVDRARAGRHLAHVGDLVAPDVGGADVERVRAFAHLGPADRHAGVPVRGRLALAKRLGAVGVAALADRQIRVLLAQRHRGIERGDLSLSRDRARLRPGRSPSSARRRSMRSSSAMCSGVVPQQPPTIRDPSSTTKRSSHAARSRAPSG